MNTNGRSRSVEFAESSASPEQPTRDATSFEPRTAAEAEPDPESDVEPDQSPVRLRREMRRRIANVGTPPEPPAEPGPPVDEVAQAFEAADHEDTDPGPSVGAFGAGPQRPPAGPSIGQVGPPPGTPGGPSGGRHARRDGQPRPPRLDYVPRHAVRTPGPGSVSPTDLTEVFSRVRQDPTEAPRSDRPEPGPVYRLAPPEPVPLPEAEAEDRSESAPAKRVRVVLSSRKGNARPVRTVVDVQELTQVGEVLSTSLIRSQLALALRIGGIALIVLGSLPAMFVIFPVLGRFELFGLRLPWLLLGGLAYPFLLLLGWWYARSAERLEQVFADHIQS